MPAQLQATAPPLAALVAQMMGGHAKRTKPPTALLRYWALPKARATLLGTPELALRRALIALTGR